MSPGPRAAGARREAWAVRAVLGGFLLLALAWSDAPLWYDEALTVLRPAGRPHHVYTGALLLWTDLLGGGLFALRLLSALLATLAAGLVVHAAGRAGGDRVTAALLVCGLPIVFRYAVELRTYAIVLAVGALSFRALFAARARPDARALAAVAASGAVAVYVHPALGVTLLAVQHLALAVQAGLASGPERARRVRGQLGAGIAQAVAVAPLLVEIRGYRTTLAAVSPDKYPGPTLRALLRAAGDLGPGAFGPDPVPLLGALGLGALVALGLRAVDRSRRASAAVLLVGPAAAAAAATPVQPMFVARVLLPIVPAAVAAAAWAPPGPPRARRRAAAAALAALGLSLSASGAFVREDYPAALEAVARRARPGDGLCVTPSFTWHTARANRDLGLARLPEVVEVEADAATPLLAAGLDFAAWPERTFVVLKDYRGHGRGLARELPLRFEQVEELGRFRGGLRVLACSGPAPRAALARTPPPDEDPWVTAFRRGVLRLRAGRPDAALEAFQAARAAWRPPASSSRRSRDDAFRLARAVALAAHLAGEPEVAREALAAAEAGGLEVEPWLRDAIRESP